MATCGHLLGSDVKASNCKFILSCSESWRADGPEENTAVLRVWRHRTIEEIIIVVIIIIII
jgi:hypothetical protein